MDIKIRKADLSDADAIFSLASVFATSFKPERDAFNVSFDELLNSDGAFLAVAETQSGIVGYVLGFDHRTFFANGRVSWVEEIMVSEDARRQRVGNRLMNEFESWARSRNSKLVALATRRAASFYKAIGYEESATYFRKLL